MNAALCLSVRSGGSYGQLGPVGSGSGSAARSSGRAALPAEELRLELHLLLPPAGGEQEPGSAAGSDCSSQHGPLRGQPRVSDDP